MVAKEKPLMSEQTVWLCSINSSPSPSSSSSAATDYKPFQACSSSCVPVTPSQPMFLLLVEMFLYANLGMYHSFLINVVSTCIYNPPQFHLNCTYEGWNFNSGNYLFTTDTKIDTRFEVLLSFNVVTSIVYNPLPAMWKS